MYVSLYDEEVEDYGDEIEYENPISKKFEKVGFANFAEYESETQKFNVSFD